jgi:hypothetical protein
MLEADRKSVKRGSDYHAVQYAVVCGGVLDGDDAVGGAGGL